MDESCGKLPFELNTPKALINASEYILSDEEGKNTYSIQFGRYKDDKSLTFQVFQKDIVTNFCYNAVYTLEDFQKLSKGFKMCESIDEILEIIIEIFASKKARIKTDKENKTISIIITIILLGGKEQEIELRVTQKISDINEINKELCNKVNILQKEINDIKNENLNNSEKINNLEKIINIQKSEIQELKQWKEKYDLELKQIIKIKEKEQKEDQLKKKINSVIIKDLKELDFLEKRLKSGPMLMKKNVIYKLLYRATKDGNSPESFHQKCDNIEGTLTIIKTTKGMRFGGYTECTWNTDSGNTVNKKDSNGIGFCYSLDLFKIYNNTNEAGSTIRCYAKEGPDFYGGDAYMFDIYFPIDSNTSSNTGYTIKCNSFGNFEKDYEINNGKTHFLMQELEIFQILFD